MQSLLAIKDRLQDGKIDWQFVAQMQTVLEPVATLTTLIQEAQYTAGDFKIDYAFMMMAYKKLQKHTHCHIILGMIEELQLCLKKRESALNHPAILAVMYLDPRFNYASNTKKLHKMPREQLDIAYVSSPMFLSSHKLTLTLI